MSKETTSGPSGYGLMLLGALSRSRRHVYGGTVPDHVKVARRVANKAARASRRINRGTK